MRKIFTDNLPRYNTGRLKDKINWKNSIGCKLKFIYEDINDEIEIINWRKGNYITVKYKDRTLDIYVTHLKKCSLGKLFKRVTNEFKLEIGQVLKNNKQNMVIIDRKYKHKKKDRKEKYYKYKCNKCNNEDWMYEPHLLKGTGCPCCGNIKKKPVLGINTIWDTARWMCDLGVSEEDAKTHTKGSNKKCI